MMLVEIVGPKTKLSEFYLESVDNSIDGYAYVDEQTNETYTMTFTNSNTLFDSRVKTRHQILLGLHQTQVYLNYNQIKIFFK